jgi:hypothetical protein
MICRLSFSGELAYEVYCGAGHGLQFVWEELMAAGEPFGIVPYGLEALGTLRIEKGHVTGAEIDGRTGPRDLYLDWMLSKKKPFIGSAMMDRDGLIAKDRLKLVGIVALDNRALSAAPTSSRRPILKTLATRSATSRPPASHRRSASISRWRWSRAARSATAPAPMFPIRCATASDRSRSSATISSIPKGAHAWLSSSLPSARPTGHGRHGNPKARPASC